MSKLYDGEVKIVSVTPTKLKPMQEKGLSEDEAAASFNIQFKLANAAGEEFYVELEVSPREGTGKAAGKKQTDMTYATLVAQKIVSSAGPDASEGDKIAKLAEAFAPDVIGRTVSIYQKESASKDKDGNPYVNTYFSNGARRLPQNEVAARLARLTGRPVPVTVAASAAAEANDSEDLPF